MNPVGFACQRQYEPSMTLRSQKTCRRKDPGTRSREVELGFIFSLGLETTLKDIKCAASENIIAIAAYFVTILTLSAYPLIELFSVFVFTFYFLFLV